MCYLRYKRSCVHDSYFRANNGCTLINCKNERYMGTMKGFCKTCELERLKTPSLTSSSSNSSKSST